MINARHAFVSLRDDIALCLAKGSARPISRRLRPAPAESGMIVVMFCVSLLVILGIFGLTFDLARLYNRRIEMQTLADAVALAAAKELNGTPQGITNALDKAIQAAGKITYDYNQTPVSWSESAIQFSASPQLHSTWLPAGSAAGSSQSLLYVKVDTNDLATPQGSIETWFIRLLPSGPSTASANGRAIAGPSMINVTPFAICAMDTDPHKKRTNPASLGPPAAPVTEELVEYGFRRGVGYDLMKLNPYASTAANFLVNPIAPPGTTGSPTDMTDAAVGPFLCAGTMAMPRLSGGTITVASQFNLRLPTLFDRFNSRFDDFTSGNCDPWAAPPDINIWRYNAALGTSIPWMSPAGPQQVAQSTPAGITPLRTLADLDAPATTASGQFGVLWSFARAVPYSSYTPGQAEPTAGYTTFNKTDWASLYDPFRPTSTGTSHPAGVSTTPYSITATNAVPSLAHRPGIRNRRVLNVPLLSCPVTGTSASVVALGKFFMTMPATANNIYAEFAGVALESSLATKVELHP